MQGELVRKDFNIVKEAGGVGKAVVRNFTTAVTNGTLEIRFYWAGKGTTGIPDRGVYGPLISAISVDHGNFYLLSALVLTFGSLKVNHSETCLYKLYLYFSGYF